MPDESQHLYAEMTDVQALIPEIKILSGSKPSETEVDSMLQEIEAEIQSVMPQAVLEGTLTTNGRRLLRTYTAMGAAVKVWMAAYYNQVMPDKIVTMRDQYATFLTTLRKGGYGNIVTGETATMTGLSLGVLRWEAEEDEYGNPYG